jgi:hypothetical protein
MLIVTRSVMVVIDAGEGRGKSLKAFGFSTGAASPHTRACVAKFCIGQKGQVKQWQAPR